MRFGSFLLAMPVLLVFTACNGSEGDTRGPFASPGIFNPPSRDGWILPASKSDNISLDGSETDKYPDVAMDDSGNTIITWGQNNRIYKSEYRNGAWTHPAGPSDCISPAGGFHEDPVAAMDNNGNAIIVWTAWADTGTRLYKSEYRSGVWTHPASLADDVSFHDKGVSDYAVAMDDNGNALIVWSQNIGVYGWNQIFLSEYRAGTWTHPGSLADRISPGALTAADPDVAMDNNGNAIVVWRQKDNLEYRIYKSEYRAGSWIHPASLSDYVGPDGFNAHAPRVALDDRGSAIIAWDMQVGSWNYVFKSEYREGLWSHPASVNDYLNIEGSGLNGAVVAMDDNGNAVIAWVQFDGRHQQVFKSEYRSGAWVHPTSLADNISPDGYNVNWLDAAMDNNGNAIIAWDQYNGSEWHVFLSEYRLGGWVHPASVSEGISTDFTDAWTPVVAMADNNEAVLTWCQGDGKRWQIFKAEYR